MSWRIWRNRLPLRGVLRSSIPDNGDWPRRFRGMGEFPASCGRETDCRFADFTFNHSGQHSRPIHEVRRAGISGRTDVKRAAASRDLRSAIPDNGGFAGWTDFLFRAGVTFKHSGQRSVFCEASGLSGEPSAGGAGQVFLTYKPILGGYACRSYTLWRPPLAT